MLTSFALKTLESAINTYIHLDPESQHRLRLLEGKVVAIEFTGPAPTFYVLFSGENLELLSEYSLEPHTRIIGSPLSLGRLGLRSRDAGIFVGDVEITGDIELAQEVKTFFSHIEIDWEEHLSQIIGDHSAHTLGQLFKRGKRWFKHVSKTLTQNLNEYIHEEACYFPTSVELDNFYDDVIEIRNDVERLWARVTRLQEMET